MLDYFFIFIDSKLALTDSWIDFFEIFLDPEISPKKNTAFGFLCQNRKSAENHSKTQFSIGQIKKVGRDAQ